MTEEFDHICSNCNSFFTDNSDFDNGFGVCLRSDNEFDPYLDDVLENSDFSCCIELYRKKRFDGDREPCPDFEVIETTEIDYTNEEDLMDKLRAEMLCEQLRTQDVGEIVEKLYNSDDAVKKKVLSSLSSYVSFGNRGAFDGLLKYYTSLPQLESISDVHFRLKVLQTLIQSKYNNELVDVLVNQLYELPSNNTTRQLYTEILKFLDKCPTDIVYDKLLLLLKEKKFSNKMLQKILSIIYK